MVTEESKWNAIAPGWKNRVANGLLFGEASESLPLALLDSMI